MLKRLKNFFLARTTRPYSRINLATLAVEITKREGGKRQVDIAQASEVLRVTLEILAEHAIENPAGYSELMNNAIAKVKRRQALIA